MTSDALLGEVQRRHDEAEDKRSYHKRFQDRYNLWRWWLGGFPILFSAAAALLAALKAPAVATAIVAFLAAIVGGAQALAQPEKNSNRHGEFEADYADLARDAVALKLRMDDGLGRPSAVRCGTTD